MDRIILNFSMLLIGYIGFYTSLQAQNSIDSSIEITNSTGEVIYEQPLYGSSRLNSTYSNLEDSGMYAADDFKLETNIEATRITVFGSQILKNLISILEGFDLIIYSDDFGKPNGDPTQIGSGILEIRNLDPNDVALNVNNYDGDKGFSFSVDILAANGGNALFLEAEKIYWICAYPRLHMAPVFAYDEIWNWKSGLPPSDPFNPSHKIDPDNRFENGADWQSSNNIQLAFRIEGGVLNVNDNLLNTIFIFPNPAQEVLNINNPSHLEISSVGIYDVLGKKMNILYKNDVIDWQTSLEESMYL